MVLNLCTLFMDVSVKMIKLKKGAHINETRIVVDHSLLTSQS